MRRSLRQFNEEQMEPRRNEDGPVGTSDVGRNDDRLRRLHARQSKLESKPSHLKSSTLTATPRLARADEARRIPGLETLRRPSARTRRPSIESPNRRVTRREEAARFEHA